MAGITDGNAAEDVDGRDEQAGDRISAHEFRCAVHGAEEGAFLFQFAAPALGLLLIDDAGGQIGVDRHLLAGDRIEREARPDLCNSGRALGDDDEIHHDEDQEHDEADDEVAAHHEAGEAADHIAGGVGALIAVGEDDARGRDVQRQAQHGDDQEDCREGGEIQRALNPQRHHEDEYGDGDGEGKAQIDEEGRYGQEQDRKDRDDADGESDIASVLPRVDRYNAVG